MKRVLGLLPEALICVAKSEAADYSEVVPAAQLLFHDDLPALVPIRNWLNRTIQEDCVVQVDDDLKAVWFLIGKKRRTTDPAVIREIIENTHRVAADLNISVFCWSRSANQFVLRPWLNPIRFATPISCSFGLRGRARQRRFDPGCPGREDFDFSMQTLLEDRILYADARFYFDHGRIFSGLGGNAGLITDGQFASATERLKQKWGRFLSMDKPGFQKGKANNVPAMSVRVRRHNPAVMANWR